MFPVLFSSAKNGSANPFGLRRLFNSKPLFDREPASEQRPGLFGGIRSPFLLSSIFNDIGKEHLNAIKASPPIQASRADDDRKEPPVKRARRRRAAAGEVGKAPKRRKLDDGERLKSRKRASRSKSSPKKKDVLVKRIFKLKCARQERAQRPRRPLVYNDKKPGRGHCPEVFRTTSGLPPGWTKVVCQARAPNCREKYRYWVYFLSPDGQKLRCVE